MQQTLDLTTLILDAWMYSGNDSALVARVPLMSAVVEFFANHWGNESTTLELYPTQALETWQVWCDVGHQLFAGHHHSRVLFFDTSSPPHQFLSVLSLQCGCVAKVPCQAHTRLMLNDMLNDGLSAAPSSASHTHQ